MKSELDQMNADLEDLRSMRLDALERAIRSRGLRRWINLAFAKYAAWAIRWGERQRRRIYGDEWQ